ncbi:MAG: hypothetical protein ABI679_15070, partial [Gemmatimonadota bacterium]
VQTGVVARALTDSFRVIVTEDGAPKAGVSVTWSVSAGSIGIASSTTDAAGRAAARMTLGQVQGAMSARASIPGGSGVTFNVTAIPDLPSQITAVSGTDQAALANGTVTQPLTVRVTDQFGNIVSGSAVAWSNVTGNGTAAAPSTLTSSSGVATVGANVGSPVGETVIRAVTAGGLDTVVFSIFAVGHIADVLVKNNFFVSGANGSQPQAVDTIAAGDAVRWIWQSAAVEHNINPQSSAFPRSTTQVTPFTYGPIRLDTPGVYTYDCTLHAEMSGIIVVQ